MFAVIFICGNLFLRIAGKIKPQKSQKLEPAKIFVAHGRQMYQVWRMLS